MVVYEEHKPAGVKPGPGGTTLNVIIVCRDGYEVTGFRHSPAGHRFLIVDEATAMGLDLTEEKPDAIFLPGRPSFELEMKFTGQGAPYIPIVEYWMGGYPIVNFEFVIASHMPRWRLLKAGAACS